MKRLLLAGLVLLALAALAAIVFAPPARVALSSTFADGSVAGTVHVHSTRSDGVGTPEDIAAAAAEAGLAFVVLTDHADATRDPDPPVYLNGVLVVDGVEISTTTGHYIALDMPAAPYPLGGEGRDVVEDVARLGGFGIVAHPDSPKTALAWRAWDAPFDGIELLNLDTAWRRRVAAPGVGAKFRLLAEVLGAFVRASETIASNAAPGDALERWASLASERRVVAIAGGDAHGGLTLGEGDGGATVPLPVPSYAAAFRALSVHVRPDAPFSGDAEGDAALLFHAIRAGHLYVALDGLASPPAFEFMATSAAGEARAGDQLDPGEPVTLQVRSNAPDDYTTVIWRNQEIFGEPHHEREFTLETDGEPAVYRITIEGPEARGHHPWILSNPIYVRARPAPRRPEPPPTGSEVSSLFAGMDDAASWRVETDPDSLAAVDPAEGAEGPELRFRWGLPGDPAPQHYAALVEEAPAGALGGDLALVFEARSENPARISVELRADRPGGDAPRRHRSIYLDSEWRTYRLPFAEFEPSPGTQDVAPGEEWRDVMFVVTRVNTAPGSSGRLWFRAVRTETDPVRSAP